MILLR